MLALSRAVMVVVAAVRATMPVPRRIFTILTRHMGRDLAGRGIRVNAISHGAVQRALPFGDAHRGAHGGDGKGYPMGRLGRPEDLVGPTLFLASPASAYVTGQILHVNGGMFSLVGPRRPLAASLSRPEPFRDIAHDSDRTAIGRVTHRRPRRSRSLLCGKLLQRNRPVAAACLSMA